MILLRGISLTKIFIVFGTRIYFTNHILFIFVRAEHNDDMRHLSY